MYKRQVLELLILVILVDPVVGVVVQTLDILLHLIYLQVVKELNQLKIQEFLI